MANTNEVRKKLMIALAIQEKLRDTKASLHFTDEEIMLLIAALGSFERRKEINNVLEEDFYEKGKAD